MRAAAMAIGAWALLFSTASAAGGMVQRATTVAAYHIVLRVGPPDSLPIPGAPRANVVMACSLQSGAPQENAQPCNHHGAVYVTKANGGATVKNATVTVTLRSGTSSYRVAARGMTSRHPWNTFHYGTDIYATRGTYGVTVTVNRVNSYFTIALP